MCARAEQAKGFGAPSPLSELPFDTWTHVLEFLPLLVMLRLFQTCRAFCALKRGVRTLDFGGTGIVQKANVLTALRLIRGSAALVTLKLCMIKIDSPGAAALAEALKGSSALTNLNLRSNNIGPTGAAALAGVLKVTSALTDLNLWDNNLTNWGEDMSGIIAIADALKSGTSALKSLSLHSNFIRDEGAVAIAQAARRNDKLESLSLGYNGIGSAGAAELAEYVRFSSALKHLDVGWNYFNEEAALSIVRAARQQDKVEVLGLAQCDIGPAGAAEIADYISFSSALKKINLGCNSLGTEGWCTIFNALRVNKENQIEEWDLEGEGINPEIAQSLAEYMKVSSALTNLNLSDNKIGPTGAAALAGALKVSSALTSLDLTLNAVGPSGAKALAGALGSSALKKLDLSYNSVKDEGASALGQGLKDNKTLQELKLHSCHIEAAGAQGLAEGLFSSALINIDLSLNQIGPTGAAALAEALKVSSALTSLDLSSNDVGPSGATSIAGSLGSSALKSLDLSSNKLCGLDLLYCGTYTDVGIKALAEALKVSSALKKLVLASNRIRDGGASAFGQGLKDNKMLEELDLRSCGIGPAGAQGLAEGLFSSALTNLNLRSNYIGPTGAAALAKAPALKNLRYG